LDLIGHQGLDPSARNDDIGFMTVFVAPIVAAQTQVEIVAAPLHFLDQQGLKETTKAKGPTPLTLI